MAARRPHRPTDMMVEQGLGLLTCDESDICRRLVRRWKPHKDAPSFFSRVSLRTAPFMRSWVAKKLS